MKSIVSPFSIGLKAFPLHFLAVTIWLLLLVLPADLTAAQETDTASQTTVQEDEATPAVREETAKPKIDVDALLEEKRKKDARLVPQIGGIFFIIGGGLFCVGWWVRRKAAEAQTWPTAIATVTRSEVTTHRSKKSGSNTRTVTYEPAVSYRYEVDGNTHSSGRMGFFSQNSRYVSRAKAEQILARYPVGAEVTIYYNPAKPEEAVIDNSPKGSGLFIAVGAFFGLVGLTMLVWSAAVLWRS